MHYQCVLCNRCYGRVNVFLLLTLHSSTFALNSLYISGNKIQQPFAFNLIHFFSLLWNKKKCAITILLQSAFPLLAHSWNEVLENGCAFHWCHFREQLKQASFCSTIRVAFVSSTLRNRNDMMAQRWWSLLLYVAKCNKSNSRSHNWMMCCRTSCGHVWISLKYNPRSEIGDELIKRHDFHNSEIYQEKKTILRMIFWTTKISI